MPRSYPCNNIQQVCAGLTKAWEFLSGQERGFVLCEIQQAALGFTEFSYFMPLRLSPDQRTGGIGVLIERLDALGVATNMPCRHATAAGPLGQHSVSPDSP